MKKIHVKSLSVAISLSLTVSLLANKAKANDYWDPTGSTGTAQTSGNWEDAAWATVVGGQATPVTFTDGSFTVFSAGVGTASHTYTVTANASHTFAGLFNGGTGTALTGNLTINGGAGVVLSLASGDQGVSTASGGITTINAVIGGTGRLENESSGSLFLTGANTYSGGTLLATSAGLNFNNNSAFGTGRITWGAGTQVLVPFGTSALTVANTMTTRAASTLIFVGPSTAPTTFSGAWTTVTGTQTLTVGNGANPATKMTISGAIGGPGNFIVNGTTGSLTLSGANNFAGTFTSGGTTKITLANNNALHGVTSLIMSGGTVGINGTSQSLGTLGMTASSTLDFAGLAGSITLGPSGGNTWVGTLNVINYNPNIDVIKFGTDNTGVTGTQLSDIVIDGGAIGAATIDPSGYITLVPEPSSIALGTLGVAGMWLVRRRSRSRKA